MPTQVAVTNSAPGVSSITRTTSYAPDYPNCRPTQEIVEPYSATYRVTTDIGYDAFGNVNSSTVTGIGMPARTTTLSWGTRGQFPVSVTNALSQVTQMGHNYDLGVPASQTDPNGISLNWGYDAFARKISETRPDGTSTAWAYADCSVSGCLNTNNRMSVTQTVTYADTSNFTDQILYLDQFDRTLATAQRQFGTTYSRVETRYDALGRVSQRSAPCQADNCTAYWSTFTYDILNRPTKAERPISAGNASLQSTSIEYSGHATILTDPNGKTTTKIGTVVGTLRRSKDHNNYYQEFAYDAFGSLLSVADSLGNSLFTATYDYGAAAYQRSVSDMDLGTRAYTYNALGELTNWSDGKGQQFSATYDPLSRQLTRTEPGVTTNWTWGSSAASYNIGQLQNISVSGYEEQYTYDNKGRLSKRRIVSDGTYDYDYSYSGTTGLPDTLTYPISTSSYRLKLQYEYENGVAKRVKDYNNTSTIFWQANEINPRGQIKKNTLGNGVVTDRTIDAVTGWVGNIRSGVGSGSALQNESYLYDLVGNVTQRQNGNLGLSENFYYDNLYRLDYSMLGGVTNLDLSYDAMGNITSRSDVASGATWTYHSTKKHAVTQAGSSSYTYGYDANGNVNARNGYEIIWTSYNYPSVINGPGKTLTFSYGPDRQRYKQIYTNGSTSETTMYIGGAMEKVTSSSGTDWRHYVSGSSGVIAVISRHSAGTNTTRYILEDHQGSIAQITDSSGALFVSESFTAFGARRDPSTWSGPCPCPDLAKIKSVTRMGYTGQEAVGGVSMGLNHMNGRVQDAITGRFLSPDPYITEPGNTQNFNRYSYVYNNPLSFTDPSGFDVQDCVQDQDCDTIIIWETNDGIGVTLPDSVPDVDIGFGDIGSDFGFAGITESLGAAGGGGHSGGNLVSTEGGAGVGQSMINATVPGAYYGGQAELAWRDGRYFDSGLLFTGSLVEAGIGVFTLGRSTAALSAARGAASGIGRFFYDARSFGQISREYWAANGPAAGRSLHHWLIPQRATWAPAGIRNAGFNLLELPALRGMFHPSLGLNQWMGFARNWGAASARDAALVENALRVGVPAAAGGAGYAGYELGSAIGEQ